MTNILWCDLILLLKVLALTKNQSQAELMETVYPSKINAGLGKALAIQSFMKIIVFQLRPFSLQFLIESQILFYQYKACKISSMATENVFIPLKSIGLSEARRTRVTFSTTTTKRSV